MVKGIIKELIILLLLSLAILLILGIVFYDYNPNNKVVPKVEAYEKSAEMSEVLSSAQTEEKSKVVLTYEITDSDLNLYKSTKQYIAGKSNPFEEYVEPQEETENNGNGGNSNNSNGGSSSGNSSNGSSNTQNNKGNNTSTNTVDPNMKGTLYDKGTSK